MRRCPSNCTFSQILEHCAMLSANAYEIALKLGRFLSKMIRATNLSCRGRAAAMYRLVYIFVCLIFVKLHLNICPVLKKDHYHIYFLIEWNLGMCVCFITSANFNIPSQKYTTTRLRHIMVKNKVHLFSRNF